MRSAPRPEQAAGLREQCNPLPDDPPLHLTQARNLLRAAALGSREDGTGWPVLSDELPSSLAVQLLRGDLANLGYRQVIGAAEGPYVFRRSGRS